ncbi:MAG: T9SS type A sorting domain-containing protein [candidate division Zixibacteria bacterium]|nr:T9SS type A sorting domain-containing protein [candidate division Zixibacteria bacterium]
MRHKLFILGFLAIIFAFSQSQAALTFRSGASGPGAYFSGSEIRVNPGMPFSIDVYAKSTDSPNRITWSSPFSITGTDVIVSWGDTSQFAQAGFKAYWDVFRRTYAESWDGSLPDLFNFTGIANSVGYPGDGVEKLILKFQANSVTLVGPVTNGQICIGQGSPINTTYDWIFDDPQPIFPTQCFTVEDACKGCVWCPNFTLPGSFCPLQKTTQWDVPVTANFVAIDIEQDPIIYSKAGGVGTVTAAGAFSWQPTCADVGQTRYIDVVATNQYFCQKPGLPTQHCIMGIVVLNTDPVIAGDCGKTFIAGGQGGTAHFTATDANIGDTKAWSVYVTPSAIGNYGISSNGVLTFTPALSEFGTTFVFTVRVTDCAGGYDQCEVVFIATPDKEYEIKIQKVENALQGHHSSVEVKKTWGSDPIYGFDFLIAYDASALTFMGADGGPLFDMAGIYQWEYFIYRFGPNGNCGNACPSGLLRVVALAEQNNGLHHPLNLSVPDDMNLFTLDFLVSNDRNLECQYVPIRFYWMDCGDNTIAYHPSTDLNPNTIVTAISNDVFEFWGGASIAADAEMPTYLGAPAICVTNPGDGKPGTKRAIDFWNGGIDIVCADSIDARGDVNLNGLANEIGDAVVFTNYFIKGLGAFTVNVEGQIAATDVNADGMALTVADLVYLIRVIVGDAVPYAKLSPYTNTANFGLDGNVVTVDAELGAAYFVFNGAADVSLGTGASSNMTLMTGTLNGNAVALVYSMDKGATCKGDILNTNGTVKSVDAVDYYGSSYKVSIPTAFSISNYPNPFNPVTNIELTLPVASDWTVSIYNVAGQKVAGFNGYGVGKQVMTWDASNVASGIYFYKAEAGKFSATRKMMLMK